MAEYGLRPGDARAVLHLGAYLSRPPDDELIAAQYAGPKAALRPIYDAVLEAVTALGDDVTVAPRKTYVSFDRGRQFALVQASTRTRADLGVRLGTLPDGTLGDVAPTGRLAPAGRLVRLGQHHPPDRADRAGGRRRRGARVAARRVRRRGRVASRAWTHALSPAVSHSAASR